MENTVFIIFDYVFTCILMHNDTILFSFALFSFLK